MSDTPYVHNSGQWYWIKKKETLPKKIILYPYKEKWDCSLCSETKEGCVYINGHLKGSGSRPYLIVCPECRVKLKEVL